MIVSCLINSINNEIGENFFLFGTAKEIWDAAAKETYSSLKTLQKYLKRKSNYINQGNLIVTQYLNTLTQYSKQLDIF